MKRGIENDDNHEEQSSKQGRLVQQDQEEQEEGPTSPTVPSLVEPSSPNTPDTATTTTMLINEDNSSPSTPSVQGVTLNDSVSTARTEGCQPTRTPPPAARRVAANVSPELVDIPPKLPLPHMMPHFPSSLAVPSYSLYSQASFPPPPQVPTRRAARRTRASREAFRQSLIRTIDEALRIMDEDSGDDAE